MKASVYSQELNNLLDTVNEMTADSASQRHRTLAEEVRSSVSRIEQWAVAENQATFVQQLAQVFNQQEKDLLDTLERPLRKLRELVDSGHLTDCQKARLLLQLGKTHDVLAEWDEALDMFYRAQDYCSDDVLEKAEILKYIGHVNAKQMNAGVAQSYYRESIVVYEAQGKRDEVAHLHLCLGFNAFESGDYHTALENYQKALDIATQLEGAEQLLGDANLALGILATVKGDTEQAQLHYERSICAYGTIGDERGLSQAYYNLGLLLVDVHKWPEAGEAYRKSLEYAKKYSDLYLIGLIHLSNTELALQLHDTAIAQASCMQAVRVFGRLGCRAQLAEAYKYSGQIQRRQRAWDRAERLFQKSIAFAAECQAPLNQAEAHHEYGLLLMDKQDVHGARAQFDAALNLFTRLEAGIDAEKTRAKLSQLENTAEARGSKPRFPRIPR